MLEALPLVILLGAPPPAAEEFQRAAAARNWRATALAAAASDAGVQALEKIVGEDADRSRVYLVGVGDGAAAVFYARSRTPHLWAAALAIGGSPKPAIDSNRLFAANAELVPLMWATGFEDRGLCRRLAATWHPLDGLTAAAAIEWLAGHRREPYPPKIDCETGNAAFARCYWLRITKFDAARRNDALPVTRVAPGSGASLALGGFGFDLARPGPGLEIAWLPDNYKGPLKLKDRLVALGGKPLADARDYVRTMDEMQDEKPTVVMIQRGRERLRLETRILLPKREENLTARVQAEFLPESRELLIVSRNVAELQADLPPAWTPATVNWNGQQTFTADTPGCWIVSDTPRHCGGHALAASLNP